MLFSAFRFPILLALGSVLGMAGCGIHPASPAPERLPVIPAKGKVTYQGKPLSGAKVTYLSIEGKASALATTDDSGGFVLSTYEKGDGAPVGKYAVLISTQAEDVMSNGIPKPMVRRSPADKALAKYASRKESPLTAEVTSNGPNDFAFFLK